MASDIVTCGIYGYFIWHTQKMHALRAELSRTHCCRLLHVEDIEA